MNVESFEDIYNKMKNSMQANCNEITDYNKGSVIRSIIESVANVGHKFYVDTKIGYDILLKEIPYSIFGFKKKEGIKAVGQVKFISSKPINADTVIDKGTIVKSGNLAFETTEFAVIKANETESNLVYCQAENIGVIYNVDANSINVINSIVPGNVVNVVNPQKFNNGTDNETENELQKRFKVFLNGLQGGNKYGIQSAVLSLPEVRSCTVEEHFQLKDDIYSFTVWVDDGTGNMSKTLEDKVREVIDGNDTADNPGKRVAGEMFDIHEALRIPINLTVYPKVARVDYQQAESEIKLILEEYVNSLTIGESVLISNLIVALKKLSYITSLSITTNAIGGGDYILDIQQIARINSIVVDFGV